MICDRVSPSWVVCETEEIRRRFLLSPPQFDKLNTIKKLQEHPLTNGNGEDAVNKFMDNHKIISTEPEHLEVHEARKDKERSD